MFTIVKQKWNEEMRGYVIGEVELHLSPAESLLILQGLRMIRDDEESADIDRKKAEKMRKDVLDRMSEWEDVVERMNG